MTPLCCLPQVSVYQVLEQSEPDAPGGKRLLAARLVPLQGSGWEVFAITQAVSAGPCSGDRGTSAFGRGVRALPRAPGGCSILLPSHCSASNAGASSCCRVRCVRALEQLRPFLCCWGSCGAGEQSVATGGSGWCHPTADRAPGLLAWHLPWGPHRCACPGLRHRGDTGSVPQVRDWTEDESSNQGLLVTVQGLGGSPLEPSPLQFASGKDHHESKKPMLVLFTDDGRRGASQPTVGFPGGSRAPRHGSSPPPCPWGAPHTWAPSNPKFLLQQGERPSPFWFGLCWGAGSQM